MNKRKINILFINPSSMPAKEQEAFLNKTSILRIPIFSMPIGLLDMAAYLREKINDINNIKLYNNITITTNTNNHNNSTKKTN